MPYIKPIEPGTRVSLGDVEPDARGGLSRDEGRAELAKLSEELDQLQGDLYAAGESSLLIVLQGLDTSGKDGTIRHVLAGVNPVGCQVVSFKVPTPDEAAHDFLWRVHRGTPARGMIAVFNRSHYEDVLVVRVHGTVPPATVEQRYDQINDFERMLAANGTIVLKFFLHISKDEQKKRLLARERDPSKAWKLSPGDWTERKRWKEYIAAYEDALTRCNTDEAPWYVVPSDHKWFRNLAVAQAIVHALRRRRAPWRRAIEQMARARLTELEALRAEGKI